MVPVIYNSKCALPGFCSSRNVLEEKCRGTAPQPRLFKMAIYHLSFKTAAKGKGRSAKAHAQYIEREGKYALSRVNEELEYRFSDNMPAWAVGSEIAFWDASDLYERANGRVYSEFEIALPREFSKEQRQVLVAEFIDKELKDQPYTVAIHNKRALDGGEQPHAHIMFSERQLDGIERSPEQFFKRANGKDPEKGGTKKNPDWNRREKIDEMRLSWEKTINRALERSGIEQRLDCRTLKEQGIDRVPEPKMGPERTQMMKNGKSTEISDQVVELRHYRTEEREVKKLQEELTLERGRLYDFGEHHYEQEQTFSFERMGPVREVPEEEKKRYQRVLDLVFTKTQDPNGHTEYRWERSGRVAFTDEGDRIVFNNTNETAIKAGLQLAKQKGWETVYVTGNEEFRRENWIQGQLYGMKIEGYKHSQADELEVARRKEELEKKKTQYRDQGKDKEKEGAKSPSKEKGLEPELERKKQEKSDDGTTTEWIPASEVLSTIQKNIQKDALAVQAVEKELYELRQYPEKFTEADAIKRAELEVSRGRMPKLEEEAKRAFGVHEVALTRYNDFVKEKGLGVWLPGNLLEERRLLKASHAATNNYNVKAEENNALHYEMDRPENKKLIEGRVRDQLLEHQQRTEKRVELFQKKAKLDKKLAPYRKIMSKLRKLGDREVQLTVNSDKEQRINFEKLDEQIRKLELEQERKRSKGLGLGR